MRSFVARFAFGMVLTGVVAFGQYYEGPSVLSQGAASRPYGVRAGRDRNIRIYGSISAIVDSGFFPVSLDSGQTLSATRGGGEASVGVYGVKRFQRSSIGIDYNGTHRLYARGTQINGADHYLGADFSTQRSSRLTIKSQATLGTSNRVFSFTNVVGGNLGAGFLPVNDLFDARVYFGRASGTVDYSITKRLSLEMGAEGFAVRRASALVGINGYRPSASLTYRLDRQNWIGAFYSFIHMDYPKAFGESDINLAGGVFARNITKWWLVESQIGLYRTDVAGKRRVAADPIVRQLLGIEFINEAFSRASNLPYINLQSRFRNKKGNYTVSYQRAPQAGNGIMLTSASETFSGIISYASDRRLSMSMSNSYTRAKSISNDIPNYSAFFNASSVSYNISRGFQFFSNILYRHSDVVYRNYPRNVYRAGIGISYGSGDIPLSYW